MSKYKTAPDCNLGLHGLQKRCCCNCEHQLLEYHHCCEDIPSNEKRQIEKDNNVKCCICGIPKGFSCLAPGFFKKGQRSVYTNQREHGLCEMHNRRITKDNNGEPIKE